MSREITIARFLMRIRPAPVAAFLKMLLGVRRREIMTPVGRFWIDPASVLGLELLEHGIHERDVTQAIRQLLRPEDTFVDIGANEGYFAVLASVFVGERGRVIAVEPQSRLQEVLARNFTLNDCRNIVVERVAVSDRPSSARLKLTPSMNNSASGFAPAAIYPLPSESVQCIRLADLLARHNVRTPCVMKVDIEGWEHEAILGSRELFERGAVRALVLELHTSLLVQRGLPPGALPEFLAGCGYTQPAEFHGHVWIRQ